MRLPPQLGPYRPLEHLGSGGMGEVYLAQAPDGALLAVKTIRADLLDRPVLRTRMLREAEALTRVRGEHLAEFVDCDPSADPPYLATRYVPGRSLREEVAEEGPLAGAALWRLADGLARALDTVHRAGYLHRDLKPANVMMVDGSPVVIDFGISHALDATRLTRHGGASGTTAYMAPELLLDGRAGTGSDVYAWAATMAYAATGRSAQWSALGVGDLARMLYAVEGLLPGLRDLLDAGMAAEPGDRPTVGELVAGLAELAPVPGTDLHVEQAHEPGTAGVTLTLPGGRRVTLDLPEGAEAGEVFGFPGLGGAGRRGGESGVLYLRLVRPEKPVRDVGGLATESLEGQKPKRLLLLLPIAIAFCVAAALFQFSSVGGEGESKRGEKALPASDGPSVIYKSVPRTCRLLPSSGVERIIPGAEIPSMKESSWMILRESGEDLCEFSGRHRQLLVYLNLVKSATYSKAAEQAMQAFRYSLREEEKNPYSKVRSSEPESGVRSFSYVRAGRETHTTIGVEFILGNVIMKAEILQFLEEGQGTEGQDALREELGVLIEKVLRELPVSGAEISPGS